MIGIVIAEFLRSWSFNKGKLYELFTPKFAIGAHAAHVDIFAVFYATGMPYFLLWRQKYYILNVKYGVNLSQVQ